MKNLRRNIILIMLAVLVVLQLNLGNNQPMQKVLAADPCAFPDNPIVAENCQVGNPASEWDISGIGDSSIQGFATDISVERGETVSFKIKTNAPTYRLDIYRMGYYGGLGARKVATVQSQNQTPNQPNCLIDGTTGLVDCGNWEVSASWDVPENATSGIYFAKAVREDTGGASHIVFIVRDDASTSDLLFQTSDTTWQAYNNYGGRSLYSGGPGRNPSRAYKVSYNRPFYTRIVDNGQDWLFNAEYPMVRWLEANGYDVSYFTGVDSDRYGDLISNHKVFLSVGHDEYWSAQQRIHVENARAIGTHLAFFSGNEVFWKTRWENSIDGSNTPYHTLVCYKETFTNVPLDPQNPPTWTGTWRDPRLSPPADGGRPENALTGTLFTVNAGATTAIRVPAEDGKMRLWRDTSIANLTPGSTATLAARTLGYEWDEDIDNGFRPPGLIRMSTTTVNNAPVLQDFGTRYASGTATHHLTLYKHSSGTLVFGSGTVQWSWGLDGNHDLGNSTPDERMQQATVNLFADMGVQPGTLQPNLVLAIASTDATAPTSTITAPTASATVQVNNPAVITGTASDTGGGVVGGVEVSVDGGTTWHPANGRINWSYRWTPTAVGAATIKSRAIDDSGNIQTPETELTVTIADRTCPCSIWNDSVTPGLITTNDPNGVELGVKFRANEDGYITGLRFYKGPQNTGTHVGTLWSSNGQSLARATFTNETATGWQQVNFSNPVAITANTVYVASYHTNVGYYSKNENYFTNSGVNSSPLYALRNGEQGANGIYRYSSTPTFPTSTYKSSNYWVDVVFTNSVIPDTTPPTVTTTTPTSDANGVSTSTAITATFDEAIDAPTINTDTFELRAANNTLVPATVTYDAVTRTAILTPSTSLETGTTYTATIKGGSTNPQVKDQAGNALAEDYTWSFTTNNTSSLSFTIWDDTATPILVTENDSNAVELGMKFRSNEDGYITGIRFYKGPQNTGTHVGNLWSSNGQLLARATFTNETATGWQEVNFTNPVAITANTVYVVSYHTNVGFYSQDAGYFANSGFNNPPLYALRNGESGANGIYRYSQNPAFPNSTYQSANYWVDVVFTTNN
jgi:hypothetical protein